MIELALTANFARLLAAGTNNAAVNNDEPAHQAIIHHGLLLSKSEA